jgi:FdhE protein
VDLIELSVAESQEPAWSNTVRIQERRAPDAPLLHGATLRVDAGSATRLVMRLAGELDITIMKRVEPLSLILVGVERANETLDALAGRLAAPADTVAVLAQLCSLPLLLNAAKTLDADASRTWQRGYCPVCGAWPSMAEMRGIQRERRMRCGCCGSDWLLPVLRCAFCDETDHQKLGVLLNEEGAQHIRVETCSTCRGYLKTLTTLGMLPFTTLATKDVSTIAYDLAARDRGYSRPSRPGFQVHVEIVQ